MVNTVFISKGINTGLKILVKRMRHRLRPETEQVKLTTIVNQFSISTSILLIIFFFLLNESDKIKD